MKWIEIFLASVASFITTISTSGEAETCKWRNIVTYTDKLSGEEIILTSKPEKFVAKFSVPKRNFDDKKSLDMQEGLSPINYAGDFNRNYGLYEINHNNLELADVAKNSDVERVLPIYTDQDGNENYLLPDQLTVRFNDNVLEQKQLALIEAQGATVLRKEYVPGYYTLSIQPEQDVFKTIEKFNSLEEVKFSEPSFIGVDDTLYVPSSTRFTEQWSLHNTGIDGGTVGADVKATDAWNITKGDSNVVIAIVDSGFALDHSNLKENIVPRPPGEDWDFADSSSTVSGLSPETIFSLSRIHGTKCASIAAATDNGEGMIGIAPQCRILPIRVNLDDSTSYYTQRANAIRFITDIKNQDRFRNVVINCSWKISRDTAGIRSEIENAIAQGIVVVGAAGNDNKDTVFYPAAYSDVISVAATDRNDKKATASNYNSQIDVCAPGEDILCAVPNNNGHVVDSGTSFAAPLVAGLAALIWSKNHRLTNLQVRQIIKDNCDDINSVNPEFIGKLGKGRINALRCLENTPNS